MICCLCECVLVLLCLVGYGLYACFTCAFGGLILITCLDDCCVYVVTVGLLCLIVLLMNCSLCVIGLLVVV